MKAPTEWLIPPKGAVPLWRLLFAHPVISESITGAVGSLSTSTDPVMVNAADSESIQVDTLDMAVQIDEQGAIVFRRYRAEDEFGRLVEREEPVEILRPWDPAADRIITVAWAAGMNAFWYLLVNGDLRLEGRHPSVLSPGRPIPIDAMRGPGSDDSPFDWWPKCKPDYAAGSLQLLSGDRVWGVHIVSGRPDPQRSLQGNAGERRLEELIRERMLASPSRKLFTREDVKAAAVERKLSENAGERAFDRAAASLPEAKDRATWRRRARLPGGKQPLNLPP